MSFTNLAIQIKRQIPNPVKDAIKKPFIQVWQTYNNWQTQKRFLNEQVAYVAKQPKDYLSRMPVAADELAGKSILIIGPGRDLYSSMVFAGYGAQVYVAEKYPIAWDKQFHPKFYRRLRQRLKRDFPTADNNGIQTVIDSKQHDKIPAVKMLPCGLEEISELANDSIDIALSNAVFEHLYNSQKAIKELFRVTKPGGTGYHQIDFRWHRDFDNPLEYCKFTEEAFLKLAADCHYECGNRLRYSEFETFFEQAGFAVDKFEGNIFAKPGYVETIRPELQPYYQQMSFDELHTLSGLFVVHRPN